MLNLTATTDTLDMVTSSAATIDVHISYVDDVIESAGPPRVDIFNALKTNTSVSAAQTTAVLAAPAASVVRNVKFISIRNHDPSVSCNVRLRFNANSTIYELFACTLLFEEEAVMREGVWFHYDANGGVYGQALPVASDTVAGAVKMATQAELEAASSTTVACSPGRQHFHPGMNKFVCMTTGGATPVMATPPSYNMTSITDAGAGRLTVTIATDFSSANWNCQTSAMYSSTTITNATVFAVVHIRSASQTAGAIEVNAHNWVTITSTLVDPTNWYVTGQGDHA